jgi:hypothetical protein
MFLLHQLLLAISTFIDSLSSLDLLSMQVSIHLKLIQQILEIIPYSWVIWEVLPNSKTYWLIWLQAFGYQQILFHFLHRSHAQDTLIQMLALGKRFELLLSIFNWVPHRMKNYRFEVEGYHWYDLSVLHFH